MDYRTHQRRLLPALATTYALSFAQQRLVDELHEVFTTDEPSDRSRRELETLAAGVKAVATWHASETIQSCREACGGAGLPALEPLRRAEGRHRRLHHLRGRQHGAAAARGQEPADRLQGRGRRSRPARAGAVRGRPGARRCWPSARRSASSPTAATCSRATRSSTCSAGATSTCSRARRGGSSAASTRSATRSRCSSTARTTCSRPPARGSTSSCSSPSRTTRRSTQLRSLYALHTIEAERGYYQEHGRLTGGRSKAVIKAVNQLCAELRPDVRALVDAFGVPEAVLGRRAGADAQERVAA